MGYKTEDFQRNVVGAFSVLGGAVTIASAAAGIAVGGTTLLLGGSIALLAGIATYHMAKYALSGEKRMFRNMHKAKGTPHIINQSLEEDVLAAEMEENRRRMIDEYEAAAAGALGEGEEEVEGDKRSSWWPW